MGSPNKVALRISLALGLSSMIKLDNNLKLKKHFVWLSPINFNQAQS